jgi:WD40 repeat protein
MKAPTLGTEVAMLGGWGTRPVRTLPLLVVLAVTACSGSGNASPTAPSASDSDATATAGSLPTTPVDGHLGYSKTEYPDVQTLFALDDDGEHQLTERGAYCCLMRVSPDREHILTMPGEDLSPVTGGMIGIDGSGPFEPLHLEDPTLNLVPQAWSPDGSRIAFEGWDDTDPARTGAYVSNVDGTGLMRITERSGIPHDAPLDFSPDGTQVVIYRFGTENDSQTGGELWVADVDGSNLHVIADTSTRPAFHARWSPDGSRIVFANERKSPTGAVWSVRPDGSELTEVYADPRGQFPIQPVWSPDGSEILFGLDPMNDQFSHPDNVLVVTDADGGDLRVVNDSPDFKSPWDWY